MPHRHNVSECYSTILEEQIKPKKTNIVNFPIFAGALMNTLCIFTGSVALKLIEQIFMATAKCDTRSECINKVNK